MARTAARAPVAAFPWRALGAALDADARARVERAVATLLRWQLSLGAWPRPAADVPDATPFVSLYAGGRLVGCFGSDEGAPGERLTRAFLRALEDSRFGGVHARDRAGLAAQVAYPIRVTALEPRRALAELEVGTHGVALAPPGAPAVLLLPAVARDTGLDPQRLLEAAAQKAGRPPDAWRSATLARFETAEVTARADASRPANTGAGGGEIAPARAWLARLVAADGGVTFAIDGRSRARQDVGPMHHGRAAVVVQALGVVADGHPEASAAHARALRRLAADLRAGLAGRPPRGFPEAPAVVAGTLALACLAGIDPPPAFDVRAALVAYVGAQPDVLLSAWHAAQITCALGAATPLAVWRAAVADLDANPWAPWTLLAARARRDAAVVARCEPVVAGSLRASGPHAGGADITPVPELALTALAVESLATSRDPAARRAALRGRRFLLRWQHAASGLRAPLDAASVGGAFPISPVVDLARCDVTAHAVLALASLR